jgi:hypothetical protein
MASKQRERFYVDGFLRAFPQFEVVDEREAPDFILRDEVGLVGLEVVQIFKDSSPTGSPAKKIEGRRQAVLMDLAKKYYAGGGGPLMVTALMPGASLGDLDRLARRLRQRRSLRPWTQTQLTICREGTRLYVTALPDEAGQYRLWRCASSAVGWVRPSCEALVAAAVAAKAAKLPSYRSAAGRVALLLVADSTRASGMVTWSHRDVVAASHGFDAVYFYRHPMAAIQVA